MRRSAATSMKKDASIALSYPQDLTACRVRSYERLKFGNSISGWTDQLSVHKTRAVLRTICTDYFHGHSVRSSAWSIR
jgi:hypothetical protein